MAGQSFRVGPKGKGRGLLAIVFSDRDKPVGRVEPELRSPTASETATVDSVNSVQSPQPAVESSHVDREGNKAGKKSNKDESPATPRGLTRRDENVTSHQSNAGPSLPTQFEDPVEHYETSRGHPTPRRGRGSQRPHRGHRLNRPNYREQKKYYQQLDTFLDDHKKGNVQSDVNEMISRRKEKDRQKEERSRRSREALEEEMRKKSEADGKTSNEKEEIESIPGNRRIKQEEVDCLQKQLQDVRMVGMISIQRGI